MERERFLRCVDCYKETVFRVAYNYLGSQYDADDAVQEVFLKLLSCAKGFATDEHIRNWLIRVTINYCKNLVTSANRTRVTSLDELPEQEQSATPSFSTTEQIDLFEAVMAMPENYRIVLHLFYYEDYSVADIAAALGVSESVVTTRLSRARLHLKESLKEVWQDE